MGLAFGSKGMMSGLVWISSQNSSRPSIRMSLNWKFIDLPSAVRRCSAEREWLISDQSTKAEKE